MSNKIEIKNLYLTVNIFYKLYTFKSHFIITSTLAVNTEGRNTN